MLSIGGRLTLINSVLSSMPRYTLSIFKVPIAFIKQVDSIRCRFLWQGTVEKRKKYALFNWQVPCFAKEVGGLRILNLAQMNVVLLLKWW